MVLAGGQGTCSGLQVSIGMSITLVKVAMASVTQGQDCGRRRWRRRNRLSPAPVHLPVCPLRLVPCIAVRIVFRGGLTSVDVDVSEIGGWHASR